MGTVSLLWGITPAASLQKVVAETLVKAMDKFTEEKLQIIAEIRTAGEDSVI